MIVLFLFNIFIYFSSYICFYTLVFHVLSKVLVKNHGRFMGFAYIVTKGSFSVYFHFSESLIFITPFQIMAS